MMWRDRLLRVLPLAVAAVGLWLTLGAVSASGETATERLAVLPPARLLIAFLAGAVVLAHILPVSPARLRPLYLAFVPLLPWLPLPIPPGFLLWHGPLASAAWILIGCLLLAGPAGAAWTRVLETAPARQLALAILLAAASYMAAAWRMAPVLPYGDEPHYVIIAQSLLYDRDLKIENNHRRGDYRAYVGRELRPDYLRRGLDREIYSIHAPGLPAVVLPAFAIAGYPGIVVFLSIVSALGAALVWRAGWRITGSPAAAWAGWAAVALSVPFYFHAFTVYPDGLGAVLVMTGAYALALPGRPRASQWRAAWHGAALALLPWLHTRYAVLAGTLGALILFRLWQNAGPAPVDGMRTRVRRCLPFLVIPALSAAGWLWFFYAIYGEFNPAAPYAGNTQTSLSRAPRGVSGLLLDQQFGLLPNAPVYLVAFSGIAALWRAHRRLASELLLVAVALHGGGRLLSNVVGWAQFSRTIHCPGPAPVRPLRRGALGAQHIGRARHFQRAARRQRRSHARTHLGGSRRARVQLSRRLRALDGPRRTARQPAAGGAVVVQKHRHCDCDAGRSVGSGRHRVMAR
jgi:hypothetical protein